MPKGVYKRTKVGNMNRANSDRVVKIAMYKTKRGIKIKKQIGDTLRGRKKPEHSNILTGRLQPIEVRNKIGDSHRGKKTGLDTIAIVDKRIKQEIEQLTNQGFRCVPVGGKIRPDIIAFRNNKIFAVEIEYKKRPNYAKYVNEPGKYFDDIIWILKHRYPIKNNNNRNN